MLAEEIRSEVPEYQRLNLNHTNVLKPRPKTRQSPSVASHLFHTMAFNLDYKLGLDMKSTDRLWRVRFMV